MNNIAKKSYKNGRGEMMVNIALSHTIPIETPHHSINETTIPIVQKKYTEIHHDLDYTNVHHAKEINSSTVSYGQQNLLYQENPVTPTTTAIEAHTLPHSSQTKIKDTPLSMLPENADSQITFLELQNYQPSLNVVSPSLIASYTNISQTTPVNEYQEHSQNELTVDTSIIECNATSSILSICEVTRHSPDDQEDPFAADSGSDSDFNPLDFDSSDSSIDREELEQEENVVTTFQSHQEEPTTSHNQSNEPLTKSRKRQRNCSNWRRNVIKKLRNSGEAYKNWKSLEVPKRTIKPPCPLTCRLHCQSKFQSSYRVKIFEEFWKLGSIDRQREFIMRNLTVEPKKRFRKKNTLTVGDEEHTADQENDGSRRKLSFMYTLPAEDLVTSRIKVCQTFFINTLAISHQMVKTVVNKTYRASKLSPSEDLRGKVQCNSRLPDIVKNSVRDHINSFDLVESHYCRKDSSKKYLPSDLNIAKMYRMYKVYCNEINMNKVASEVIYRQVFNKEFNLGFFIPKKDQCDLCNKYKNSSPSEKEDLRDEIDAHQKNKEMSRLYKNTDKERAKLDNTFCMAIYDLQKVLNSPKAEVSQLYYRRKLACYNLTVYDAANKQGYCYMWPETIASRGSCEIASCIYAFITDMVQKGIKEFSFYSDNCAGQNRNRFIYCMYMYCAKKYGIKISHNFLEKGHTQNECDSVHGVIERASKNIPIYSPQQWYILARTSCKVRPYVVKEMCQEDFFDFKDLLNNVTKNWDKTEDGVKVSLNNIKKVIVNAVDPYIVRAKYNHHEAEFSINTVQLKRSNNKLISLEDYNLKVLRNLLIPISAAKYKDLVFLCDSKVIPTEYHTYFKSLSYTNRQEPDEDINEK